MRCLNESSHRLLHNVARFEYPQLQHRRRHLYYVIAMTNMMINTTTSIAIPPQIILSVLSNCQNPSTSSKSSSTIIICSISTSAAMSSSGLISGWTWLPPASASPGPSSGSRPALCLARRLADADRRTRGPCLRPPGAACATANAPTPPVLATRRRAASSDLTRASDMIPSTFAPQAGLEFYVYVVSRYLCCYEVCRRKGVRSARAARARGW
mmetsp:Transcript_32280/g.77166  ORF Transcript_32280/g.77166 Transcript_32280/m.77166 type:complete len:212 (+) Transcript_32280:135-770(+)